MKLSSWDGWTKWEKIVSIDQSNIPESPGVYMIGAHDKLYRVHGIDEEGILDVGESDNLRDRIKAFIGCASGARTSGHMAGWRYHNFDFNSKFPLDKLWICWKSCNTKEEAYSLEGTMLNSYIEQHYELPPLNYKFNWTQHKT